MALLTNLSAALRNAIATLFPKAAGRELAQIVEEMKALGAQITVDGANTKITLASGYSLEISGTSTRLRLVGGADILFDGTNDQNKIVLANNLASALEIQDGSGAEILRFDTTTGDLKAIFTDYVSFEDQVGFAAHATFQFANTTAVGTGGTSTATANAQSGIVTTDAITTAAGAEHVMTVTNTFVTANSKVLCTLARNGSAGLPIVASVEPGSGSFVVRIANIHASVALNAAVKIGFMHIP